MSLREATELSGSGQAPDAYFAVEGERGDEAETDRLLPPKKDTPKGGHPHLDVTRIICVLLVAIDHGDPDYSAWNVIFVQQWTMQWIVLVCGIAFCLSSKSLGRFCCRLSAYAAAGVLVNWLAWVYCGMDWKSDFGSVVFQNWFIVGLMAFCAIVTPVRSYLLKDVEELEKRPDSEERASHEAASSFGRFQHLEADGIEELVESPQPVATSAAPVKVTPRVVKMALAFVGIGILCHLVVPAVLNPLLGPALLRLALSFGNWGRTWGMPTTLPEAEAYFSRFCGYFFLTLSNLYLMRAIRGTNAKPSVIPWVMMANAAVNRSVLFRGPEERPFHLLDLMMLGMVTYAYGLRHRKLVGDYICRYWFLVLISFALMWPPSLNGRLDVTPTHDIGLRCKAELMESICVLAWLSAAERFFSREIFTLDRLGFLNDWALLLFLVHKAVHMIVGPPRSWLVLLALLPVARLFRRRETM